MPIGKVIQTCQNTGNWSGMPIGCKRVECGQVPGLANGEIHVLDGRTTYGARVRYKCKTDYSLIGGKNKIIYIKTREINFTKKDSNFSPIFTIYTYIFNVLQVKMKEFVKKMDGLELLQNAFIPNVLN